MMETQPDKNGTASANPNPTKSYASLTWWLPVTNFRSDVSFLLVAFFVSLSLTGNNAGGREIITTPQSRLVPSKNLYIPQ